MDTAAHTVWTGFERLRSLDVVDGDLVKEMPKFRIYQKWIMSLAKSALDNDCLADAQNFQDRVFEWDHHRIIRNNIRRQNKAPEATLGEMENVCVFSQLAIAGWAIRSCSEGRTSAHSCATIVKAAVRLVDKSRLMNWWEVSCDNDAFPELERSLGIDDWPRSHVEYRSGRSHSWSGHDDWLFEGMLALLLTVASEHGGLPTQKYDGTPRGIIRGHGILKSTMEKVLKIVPEAMSELGITIENQQRCIDNIQNEFAARRRTKKLEELKSLLSISVTSQREEQIRQEILEALSSPAAKGVVEIIMREGPPEHDSNQWFYPRITYELTTLREVFGAKTGGYSEGKLIAEQLLQIESEYLSWILDHTETYLAGIDESVGIQDAFKKGQEEMLADGYEPNVALIPEHELVIKALFGVSSWEIPSSPALELFKGSESVISDIATQMELC